MTQQTPDLAVLKRYADGPAQLEAAIAGLTDAGLDVAPEPGSWTIREIVHHLADGDDLWKVCVKAAFGQSQVKFSFQWYWDLPQDTWAERWGYARRAVEPSLALFRANRRHVTELVQEIPDAWEQCILIAWPAWPHRPPEQVTVGDIIEMQANHVDGHVEDICAIRQAHNL